MTQYYSPSEVADILSCNTEVVRRWTREGKLGCVHLGGKYIRISADDLAHFIKKQRK